MRDLLFKNLTSLDKKRRIVASCEVVERQGMRSTIQRHFICVVKEIAKNETERPLPYLYIRKERNNRELKERFFCKIKGSIFAIYEGRLFLITFMHSLKINLEARSENLVNYNEGNII